MKNVCDLLSSNEISRRRFVKACAGCLACAAGWPALSLGETTTGTTTARSITTPLPPGGTRIRVFYLFPDRAKPNWPHIGYDFDSRIREIETRLKGSCPEIEFVTTRISVPDVPKVPQMLAAETESGFDGYLVYLVGLLWGDVTEKIAATGKPTIIADEIYSGSGEFLTSYARAKRAGHRVTPVSSSEFDDLVRAIRVVSCLAQMRRTRILVVGKPVEKAIENEFGTTLQEMQFDELRAACDAADKTVAKSVARRWIMGAKRVVEPSRDEITRSATMYLAMRDLLTKYKADAITVHCLKGFYAGRLQAYPCLGFMELDDEGRVGACEADQNSTLTKLLMTKLTGRPGFISDPVIDTAKNQVIYAHCVASTRMYGPDGRANPYIIRSHSEDRKGASVQSLLPVGELTTTVEIHASKRKVLLHQAVAVANFDEERACRTKLAAEAKGDIRKLMRQWDEWGWHRVTFYGDWKQQVFHVADLLGFEVIEEA